MIKKSLHKILYHAWIILSMLSFVAVAQTDTVDLNHLSTDSLKSSFIRGEKDLEQEIQQLLNELNDLDYTAEDVEESIHLFEYNTLSNNSATIQQEFKRLSQRSTLRQEVNNYSIPFEGISQEQLVHLSYQLELASQSYHEPYVKYIIVKNLLHAYFILGEFNKYLQLYNSHQLLLTQFSSKDIFIQLSQVNFKINKPKQGLAIAEEAYYKFPEDYDIYAQYMIALITQQEYAELEYYVDKMLVYNDLNSLIQVALFQFSRGNIADAITLTQIIEDNINKYLKETYNFKIQDFKWNYNQSRIVFQYLPRFQENTVLINPMDLYQLSHFAQIHDEKQSCRLLKYSYMSSFSYLDEWLKKEPYSFSLNQQIVILKKTELEYLREQALSQRCD